MAKKINFATVIFEIEQEGINQMKTRLRKFRDEVDIDINNHKNMLQNILKI